MIIFLLLLGCGVDPADQYLSQLCDTDVEVRRAAINALDEFEGEHIVAALAGSIDDADHQVRHLAIQALARRGNQARSQLAILEATLEDSNSDIRVSAALTIQAIDPSNQKFVPVLVEALLNAQHNVFL